MDEGIQFPSDMQPVLRQIAVPWLAFASGGRRAPDRLTWAAGPAAALTDPLLRENA